MAEKRVSVRLAAVGGRQVRAELEGVGEAGAKGMGRLSREMYLANTRLAAFARRAGLALGAAAAAATASLGLIVRSTAESAAQIRQFAQIANTTPEALQRWSAGARTVGIEQEKLADILKDVNDRVGDFLQTGGGPMADFFENVAPRVGVTADQFARLSGPEALQLYVDTLERAGLSQQEMTFYLEAMASDATRLLPLLRNGGAEMARLGDQASDLGAVLDSDALEALRRTQLALGTVSLVFDGLRNRIAVAVAPTIEALADAFVALASDGGILRSAIDGLIGNLGRLASYAATFAAVMAGRWVAGFAAAALSVRGLATALVVLRGALIRTGIGALIVGAGELVYQFGRLVRAAGGFGTVMGRVADVGREAWDRIKLAAVALSFSVESAWHGIKAAVITALAGALDSVITFADRSVALFQGAYDATKAIWGALPGAIGDFAFGAANALISGVEAMLNGVVTLINSFVSGLNAALELLPGWVTGGDPIALGQIDPLTLGRIDNPFAGQAEAAGAAAGEAFRAAMAETHVAAPDLGLEAMADTARAAATMAGDLAGDFWRGATAPMDSLAALGAAMTSVTDEMAAGAAAAEGATAGLNQELAALAGDGAGAGAGAGAGRGGGGGTAGAAAEALDAVTEAAEAMAARARSGARSVAEMLSGIVTGGKSALDVMGDLVMRLADVQIQRAIFGLNAGGIGTGVFGLLGLALTPPSFAGGGYTGSGPRSGGLDGKGGFMALLHPQETVIDHLRSAGRTGGRTGAGTSPGAQAVTIHVEVSGANGDRQIMAMVEAGVSRGLAAYDRQLPGRIDGISRDRRAR
jgi:hypothetical protein